MTLSRRAAVLSCVLSTATLVVAAQLAAQAKPAEKPILTQGSKDGSKPKRELPPYLRVVK